MADLKELLRNVEAAMPEQQGEILWFVQEALFRSADRLDLAWVTHFRGLLQAGGYESAALALLERSLPGWHWQVEKHPDFADATLWPDGESPYYSACAPTPPLALLAALLKALIAKESDHG